MLIIEHTASQFNGFANDMKLYEEVRSLPGFWLLQISSAPFDVNRKRIKD